MYKTKNQLKPKDIFKFNNSDHRILRKYNGPWSMEEIIEVEVNDWMSSSKSIKTMYLAELPYYVEVINNGIVKPKRRV